MAEFDTPDGLVHAAESARLAGYRMMDAYSPIPIEELSEALGLAADAAAETGLPGRAARRDWRVQPRVLLRGDRLSAQYRGTSASQLAAVHSGDVRDDRPRRGTRVFRRDVGAQSAAATVPPGVQRAGVRAGIDRPLLPVHRGCGSGVQAGRNAAVSRRASSARSFRSCLLAL